MAVRAVQRRGERRLVIDFSYTKPDGTKGRYRHDAEVQTRGAAAAEERRLLVTLTTTGAPMVPVVPKSTAPLFKSVVKDYLATYAVTAIKPSTKSGYEKLLTGFLLPRIGDMPIDKIDAATAREADAAMVERGGKPGTRRQVQIVMRSILRRYAVEAGLLKVAPAFPAMVKQGAKLPAAMTHEEVEAALAATKTPGHLLAFLLASDAGLRAGEVRGLRRCDVDLDTSMLTVREARCRGATAPPKSGHEREVPLTPRLRAAIEARGKGSPKQLLALTLAGNPWGEYGLNQAFARVCKRAGVEAWRYHDLRHYFTSTLFRGGTGAPTVQALLGHGSLAVTSRYAHSTRADAVDAIGRLGRGNSVVTGKK